MIKTIRILLCTAFFVALSVSCQNKIDEVESKDNRTIEISINGLMGEYTQVDATKSSLVNTVRVSWEADDIVFVYDGTKCLGSLVASLDGTEDRYALLSTDGISHTIEKPAEGTTRLTLVHSPLLTEAPSISEGAISISLADQNGAKAPFVAFATLDYNNEESIDNAIVPFKFATSVIKVNCTGLDANTAITSATLSNVNTVCKLNISGTAAPTVAGDVNGTISRTGDDYFAAEKVNSEGVAVFQIASPILVTASEARVLNVAQGSDIFKYNNFSKESLPEATSVNTVCPLFHFFPVERVSLDKSNLSLNKGTSFPLTPTVYPDNATDKSVTWSSSDESVATVDASGIVTAISVGTATITVTTADGLKSATCTVVVMPEFHSGKFSVAEGNQVYFSPGNLWYEAKTGTFNFEDKQYDSASDWNADHVSYFFWSKTASVSCAESYSDSEANVTDTFFTNSTDDTANPDFIVNGISGKYRTLSEDEWVYLFNSRTVNGRTGEDNSYSLDITYCGMTGLVLYPDDYTGDVISGTVTSLPEEVVFLPAVGCRIVPDVKNFGIYGCYWSASPMSMTAERAYLIDCTLDVENEPSTKMGRRDTGFPVRLVTDVK